MSFSPSFIKCAIFESSLPLSHTSIFHHIYIYYIIKYNSVGNAEPTSSSFAAWIPSDGEITTSLHNTKYPVTSNEINLAIGPYGNTNNHQLSQEEIIKLFVDRKQSSDDITNNNSSDNGVGGQYDIIVLGMQEAAFVSKKSATERSGNDDSERVADATTTTDNNNNINNSGEANNNNNEVIKKKERSRKSSSKKGPLEKAANKAGMLLRGVSANQTYKRK